MRAGLAPDPDRSRGGSSRSDGCSEAAGPSPCGRLSRPRSTTTPLRLPLDHPLRLPGSPVIGGASLPANPADRRGRDGSPGFPGQPSARSTPNTLEESSAPAPGPRALSVAFVVDEPTRHPLSPASRRALVTTLVVRASLALQTARSIPPRFAPGSQPRTGASVPGTKASPRTGITPAGHPELIAPTSCGPPFPHGAGAVPAHSRNTEEALYWLERGEPTGERAPRRSSAAFRSASRTRSHAATTEVSAEGVPPYEGGPLLAAGGC